MDHKKISVAEKQMIKGLIKFHVETNRELKAEWIENDIMRLTNITNMEHRYAIERYAQQLIDKL